MQWGSQEEAEGPPSPPLAPTERPGVRGGETAGEQAPPSPSDCPPFDSTGWRVLGAGGRWNWGGGVVEHSSWKAGWGNRGPERPEWARSNAIPAVPSTVTGRKLPEVARGGGGEAAASKWRVGEAKFRWSESSCAEREREKNNGASPPLPQLVLLCRELSGGWGVRGRKRGGQRNRHSPRPTMA